MSLPAEYFAPWMYLWKCVTPAGSTFFLSASSIILMLTVKAYLARWDAACLLLYGNCQWWFSSRLVSVSFFRFGSNSSISRLSSNKKFRHFSDVVSQLYSSLFFGGGGTHSSGLKPAYSLFSVNTLRTFQSWSDGSIVKISCHKTQLNGCRRITV